VIRATRVARRSTGALARDQRASVSYSVGPSSCTLLPGFMVQAARAAAFKMLPHARALRCHTVLRALPPLPPAASPLLAPAPAHACVTVGVRHAGLPAPLRNHGLCVVPLGRRRRLHVRAGASLTPVRPSPSSPTEELPRVSPSGTVCSRGPPHAHHPLMRCALSIRRS
jgi:hypothetical protein